MERSVQPGGPNQPKDHRELDGLTRVIGIVAWTAVLLIIVILVTSFTLIAVLVVRNRQELEIRWTPPANYGSL